MGVPCVTLRDTTERPETVTHRHQRADRHRPGGAEAGAGPAVRRAVEEGRDSGEVGWAGRGADRRGAGAAAGRVENVARNNQKPLRYAVPRIFTRLRCRLLKTYTHAANGIQAEGLLHQQCQAVDVEPEVNRLAVQVDLQGFVETEHRSPSPSASITSAICGRAHSRRSTTTPLGRRACSHIATSTGRRAVAGSLSASAPRTRSPPPRTPRVGLATRKQHAAGAGCARAPSG